MTEKKHDAECAAIIELINSYLQEMNKKDLREVYFYIKRIAS